MPSDPKAKADARQRFEQSKQTPTATPTPSTSDLQTQMSAIKSQAANIVTQAQKLDPNIKISAANAEMIGLPKVNIPTQKEKKPVPTELGMVGTTPMPKTGADKARDAILSQIPEADRDTISQILDVASGYQTDRGRALEGTAESLLTQQLKTISDTRDRAREESSLKEANKLPELEAELESIRSENDVLTARKNAAIQAEERREGVSTAARAGNVERISRDFNLEQANLAIRELASVGKINAATKLIEAKLDLKYGDLEAESNLLTAQLNAISPFLSREDQKAAETRLQLNEIVKTKIADAREADKALEEFKLQSYLFAQQNGATPAILSSIMSSTSREDVASVGGAFIQEPEEAQYFSGNEPVYKVNPDGTVTQVVQGRTEPTVNLEAETSLRKEFNGLDVVKQSNAVKQSYAQISAAYKNAVAAGNNSKSKSAADQALIISFNKMLDPGSVVREGEFARSAEGQALIDRYKAKADAVINGGAGLTDSERLNIVNLTKDLYADYLSTVNNTAYEYRLNASRQGADPDFVANFTDTTGVIDPKAARSGQIIYNSNTGLVAVTDGNGGLMPLDVPGSEPVKNEATLEQIVNQSVDPNAPQSKVPKISFNDAVAKSANSIALIESGGNYRALGPVINTGSYKGDRAYGRYQVMGKNIPSWSQKVLGYRLTPEQFLANPAAQDKIFAGIFGNLAKKHGSLDDAASAWFSGQPLSVAKNRQDQLGTSTSEYVKKFRQNLSLYS